MVGDRGPCVPRTSAPILTPPVDLGRSFVFLGSSRTPPNPQRVSSDPHPPIRCPEGQAPGCHDHCHRLDPRRGLRHPGRRAPAQCLGHRVWRCLAFGATFQLPQGADVVCAGARPMQLPAAVQPPSIRSLNHRPTPPPRGWVVGFFLLQSD